MRVLHLITWLVPGGIENWLLNMAQAIPRSQCAMDFCCKGAKLGSLVDYAHSLGADVVHCRLPPTLVGFVRRLRQILIRGRYDLLHLHLDAHNGLPTYAAKSLGLPVIVTFHSTRFAPMEWWTVLPGIQQLRSLYTRFSVQYTLRHATLITGVSQAVLDAVSRWGRALPESARLLHLGTPAPLPLDAEQKRHLRQTLGVPGEAPLVLHAGGLSVPKNHLGLLDAFDRLAAMVPGCHLVIAGEGPLRPQIEQRIAISPSRQQVHLLGMRSDVAALMQTADVFLFPSVYEGLPVVLIEAQAAGLPIVASRIPGVTEVVEESRTAILHVPTDVQALAESAADILRHPQRAAALADAGRRRYQSHFTVEAAAGRLLDCYRTCLAPPTNCTPAS